MTSATATIPDLIRTLAAAVPFAASDDLPPIACVRIEAGGGALTATATNRYIAAHVRTKATGELGPTFVPTEHATALLDFLKGSRSRDRITGGSALAEVSVADGALCITADGAALTVPTAQRAEWPEPVDAAFADGPTQNSSALGGPIAINLKWLHQIHAATDTSFDIPAVLSFSGPRGMVRVEIGDWFMAIVMPMQRLPKSGPVPFGIPAPKLEAATC